MKVFNLAKLNRIMIAFVSCGAVLFGSVVQTASAKSVLDKINNMNQISYATANRDTHTAETETNRKQFKARGEKANHNKTDIKNENVNTYNINANGDVAVGSDATINKGSFNDYSKDKNATIDSHNVKDSHNTTGSNNTNIKIDTKQTNSAGNSDSKTSNTVTVKRNPVVANHDPVATNNANNKGRSKTNAKDNDRKNSGFAAQKNEKQSINNNEKGRLQGTVQNNKTKIRNSNVNTYNINAGGDVAAGSGATINKESFNDRSENKGATIGSYNTTGSYNTKDSNNTTVKINTEHTNSAGSRGANQSVKTVVVENNPVIIPKNENNKKVGRNKGNNNRNNGYKAGGVNNKRSGDATQNNQIRIRNKEVNEYNIDAYGDVAAGSGATINNNSYNDESKNKGAVINSHNTENSHNITNSGNVNIEIKETINESINHDPQGKLDSIQYKGVNQVYVKGWAYDEDNLNTAVNVEFRVGSENSDTKFTALANKLYSTQIGNHGFDGIYNVDLSKYVGWQEVHAFAKNIGNKGTDKNIGSGRINIPLIVNGNASINKSVENDRKFEVKGWTNTTRVDVFVGGKKLYQINVNNPNNIQQNFANTYTLPNDYNGQQVIVIEAVDATNISNKKEIGRDTISIEDWEYASLPDGWYEIVSAATSGVLFDVKNDLFVEGNKVYASGSYSKAFYLQNVGNKYFTLKAEQNDCYLSIPVIDCAKLSKSSTNSTSRWRLMYAKLKGTGSGYYLESQSAQNTAKRVLGVVNGQDLGLKEPLDYDSYRWKFVPVSAPKPPKPDVDGSVSVIENQENNKVHIKGWANTSRVDVVVGNTSYQISINNPNYERKDFDDVHTLSNNITGTQQVTVKAVDAADTSRNKNIGSGQVKQHYYNPEGECYVEIKNYNEMRYWGTAFDRDDPNTNLQIKLYFNNDTKESLTINTNNKHFDQTIQWDPKEIPEGGTLNKTVRIKAVNIQGGQDSFLYNNSVTFKSPIKVINEVRIARANNADGIPAKQFVDVYKENLKDKTYFVKYFNCDYRSKSPQGGPIENWINKDSVDTFACFRMTSIRKKAVYVDSNLKNIAKTRLDHEERIFENEDIVVIGLDNTYGSYCIRYLSIENEDDIRKDRWDEQSNYWNRRELKPNGQWIPLT